MGEDIPKPASVICKAATVAFPVSVSFIFAAAVKSDDNVPTLVIFGCAAVVSVSAVADNDAGTVVSAI